MKFANRNPPTRGSTVAPFTGAWIEIYRIGCNTDRGRVAPFTGAWIEISRSVLYPPASGASHPSRVRGLKYFRSTRTCAGLPSHPSRVRGLKFKISARFSRCMPSHPSRVRGLKYRRRGDNPHEVTVAPFTGAWIEIFTSSTHIRVTASHPSRVRGLKSKDPGYRDRREVSHPSRVRGLKFY